MGDGAAQPYNGVIDSGTGRVTHFSRNFYVHSKVAEYYCSWSFLPLLSVRSREDHRGMEIVVVLVLLAALTTAVLHTVHTDGRGHTPSIRSHAGWGNTALPSRSYSEPTREGV